MLYAIKAADERDAPAKELMRAGQCMQDDVHTIVNVELWFGPFSNEEEAVPEAFILQLAGYDVTFMVLTAPHHIYTTLPVTC